MENKTPNCAICKWFLERVFVFPFPSGYYCKAQGMKEVEVVYNNKECKKLFEEKNK